MAKKPQNFHMSRFKNRCFVGLNKVTFYTEAGDVLEGDNWLELTDEQSRRSMMLAFFAPRDLNGEPMDPADVLFDESEESENAELLQQIRSISMFDLCRAEHAPPNVVHVVLVADVIFHWDNQDNYIQPTSDDTWAQDLQDVLKGYPRTTEKHIYTDWEFPPKVDLGKAEKHPLQDMPLDQSMWLNQPTFQEQYGNILLIAGVLIAALTYFGLSYQEGQIEAVNQKTRALNAQTRLYPNYSRLVEKVNAIEAYNAYKGLFPFAFKDVALAAADIGMPLERYNLKNPKPTEPPKVLVTELETLKEKYSSFAEQEPLAQGLLAGSLSVQKIRKPATSANSETFTLQGLIPLDALAELHREEQQSRKSGRRQAVEREDGND